MLGIALLPAFISGAIQLEPRRTAALETITPAELIASQDELVWVDARSEAAFAKGHVAGALPLDEARWNELIPPFLDAWYPARLVVVYGDPKSPRASRAVALRLRESLQIKNVRVLEGDWQRWREK